MAHSVYSFCELSEAERGRLQLDPIPFPVRTERVTKMFDSGPVPVDDLLEELDQFLADHPDLAEKYRSNVARLAMICATRHASRGDFAAALTSLNAGLRADPQHPGLRAHQALALQIIGYPEAAAIGYEQLLWNAPQAFDPMIRALAAKAFVAIGDKQKARETLEFLPERVFQDPSLKKLRESLRDSADRQPIPAMKFCTKCGSSLRAGEKFCHSCGAQLAA